MISSLPISKPAVRVVNAAVLKQKGSLVMVHSEGKYNFRALRRIYWRFHELRYVHILIMAAQVVMISISRGNTGASPNLIVVWR